MTKEPIFIVGFPRSGTTLLAAILAAHSQISCGPETHFFRRLAQQNLQDLCDPINWPRNAVEFLRSITHTNFDSPTRKPLLEKYGLTLQSVEAHLSQRSPSIPAILAAVTEQYMQAMGKCRWAEKTPDHLEQLPIIRRYYPNSSVIRIIRDPRDAALSLTKVPWGAKSFEEAILLWKRAEASGAAFFSADSLGYTLRYEDLVASPQEEMMRLCKFIGEEYEESMLDTSATGRQVNTRNVVWKERASQPIDDSRVNNWKKSLSTEDNVFAEAILGDSLMKYGYHQGVSFDAYGDIYPNLLPEEKYAGGLKKIAGRGVRFWKISSGEHPAIRIFLGDPGEEGWINTKGTSKLAAFSILLINILKFIFTRKKLFWITNNNPSEWTGFSAFVIKRLLSPYLVSE